MTAADIAWVPAAQLGLSGWGLVQIDEDDDDSYVRGCTGELMDCVVPKDDVLVFIPDGYEVFLRLPRSSVYIQGNPDGKNTGYA